MKKIIVLSLALLLYGCGGGGDSETPNPAPTQPVVQTPAVIGGETNGLVIVDGVSVATGNLTISDQQSGEATFQVQSNEEVTYGTFSISQSGEWSYTLNQTLEALQSLVADSENPVFITVLSADNTAATITITVKAAPASNSDFILESETIVNSDGVNTGLSAYQIIENAFADGSIESPDLYSSNHNEVVHIYEDEDAIQGNHFVFLAHRDLDYDRDKDPSDRQRNEIKTYDKSSEELKSYEGQTFQYSWRFKVSSELELSSRFSHFFQIKAKNFSENNSNGNDDQPIFTISGAESSSAGNQLQVRYNKGFDINGNNTDLIYLAREEWSLITDEWVEVNTQITYAEEGKFSLTLTRLSDQAIIIDIQEDNIDTWRGVESADFVRPKWGIYRSIIETESLRATEEQVRFANFTIRKGRLVE